MKGTTPTSQKVGVYVRVSTLDQDTGLASQEHAIQQYLDGHGIDHAKWYRDRRSGKSLERPALLELQADIFNGQVKTVIVWKLDRLARSLKDGINTLCDWLEKGVRVVAVAQQLDFDGPVGKLVASVLFALAEMERVNLRENVVRGLERARANGKRLGRPPKADKATVRHFVERGCRIADIAKEFNLTRQAVYQQVKRAGLDVRALRDKEAHSERAVC